MKVFYDADTDPQLIKDKRIAVIGYGSQGHAHANNLKDSGCHVIVGLAAGSRSWDKAKEAGFEVLYTRDAAESADLIMVLVPDELAPGVYRHEIAPSLTPGKSLAFAHGFGVHFGKIMPPADVNVFLVAPKGPGHLVRSEYVRDRGVPCLLAVHQDVTGDTREIGLSYAWAVGGGKAGIIETNFKEETETDLFGEQAVLCGGLTSLIQAGFETLTEAGYAPEMAYFECLHEMKLIVDLLYEGGFEYMRYSISDVAEYGDLSVGTRIVDDSVRDRMRGVLDEIRSGAFAKELFEDDAAGRPRFKQLREQGNQRAAKLEQVGKELRELAGAEGLHGVGARHPVQ